jgi:hypothetical protein
MVTRFAAFSWGLAILAGSTGTAWAQDANRAPTLSSKGVFTYSPCHGNQIFNSVTGAVNACFEENAGPPTVGKWLVAYH